MPRPNTVVHPCREEQSIDSRVHGNRTLYATIRILLLQTNIIFKLLFAGCLPRREVEEDISEALLIVDDYNLLLYNVAATFAALLLMLMFNCINCWLSSSYASRIAGRC